MNKFFHFVEIFVLFEFIFFFVAKVFSSPVDWEVLLWMGFAILFFCASLIYKDIAKQEHKRAKEAIDIAEKYEKYQRTI